MVRDRCEDNGQRDLAGLREVSEKVLIVGFVVPGVGTVGHHILTVTRRFILGHSCGVLEDACMTHRSISLNTLRALPAADRAQALAELAANAAAPRNGQSAVLDARIRVFERQYEMT